MQCQLPSHLCLPVVSSDTELHLIFTDYLFWSYIIIAPYPLFNELYYKLHKFLRMSHPCHRLGARMKWDVLPDFELWARFNHRWDNFHPCSTPLLASCWCVCVSMWRYCKLHTLLGLFWKPRDQETHDPTTSPLWNHLLLRIWLLQELSCPLLWSPTSWLHRSTYS